MPEAKRKTHTSTEVKRRYNEKTYTLISASVPKETAAAFKAKCAAEGIPQAQIIKKAIYRFISTSQIRNANLTIRIICFTYLYRHYIMGTVR